MILLLLTVSLYLAGCGALFYTAFCRLTMTDHETRIGVRALLCVIAGFATGSIFATVVYGYQPIAVHMAVVLGLLGYKIGTRKEWARGVPRSYLKPHAQRMAESRKQAGCFNSQRN